MEAKITHQTIRKQRIQVWGLVYPVVVNKISGKRFDLVTGISDSLRAVRTIKQSKDPAIPSSGEVRFRFWIMKNVGGWE